MQFRSGLSPRCIPRWEFFPHGFGLRVLGVDLLNQVVKQNEVLVSLLLLLLLAFLGLLRPLLLVAGLLLVLFLCLACLVLGLFYSELLLHQELFLLRLDPFCQMRTTLFDQRKMHLEELHVEGRFALGLWLAAKLKLSSEFLKVLQDWLNACCRSFAEPLQFVGQSWEVFDQNGI